MRNNLIPSLGSQTRQRIGDNVRTVSQIDGKASLFKATSQQRELNSPRPSLGWRSKCLVRKRRRNVKPNYRRLWYIYHEPHNSLCFRNGKRTRDAPAGRRNIRTAVSQTNRIRNTRRSHCAAPSVRWRRTQYIYTIVVENELEQIV
jgi:hypothetical protein